MREDDAQRRATEFVKELYAAGDIDAARLDAGVAGVLAARTEAELAGVVRSMPAPVALTSPDRRLAKPLEIKGGINDPPALRHCKRGRAYRSDSRQYRCAASG